MPARTKTKKYVICVDNDEFDDLELRKVYEVIPDKKAQELACFRVIDESGEDYLYPVDSFVPVSVPKEVRAKLIKAQPAKGSKKAPRSADRGRRRLNT